MYDSPELYVAGVLFCSVLFIEHKGSVYPLANSSLSVNILKSMLSNGVIFILFVSMSANTASAPV